MPHVVICQEWEESERGWGVRPDGASLHLTEEARKAFCDALWARLRAASGNAAPYEYSRESGPPTLIEVDDVIYKRIKDSQVGLMLSESDYSALRTKMKKG